MPLPPYQPAAVPPRQQENESAIPGLSLLKQLFGGLFQPEFKGTPQVEMGGLISEMQLASEAGDKERFHNIRKMIERRSDGFESPGQRPQKKEKKTVSSNPFEILVQALKNSQEGNRD